MFARDGYNFLGFVFLGRYGGQSAQAVRGGRVQVRRQLRRYHPEDETVLCQAQDGGHAELPGTGALLQRLATGEGRVVPVHLERPTMFFFVTDVCWFFFVALSIFIETDFVYYCCTCSCGRSAACSLGVWSSRFFFHRWVVFCPLLLAVLGLCDRCVK